jgi:hypothetical protein
MFRPGIVREVVILPVVIDLQHLHGLFTTTDMNAFRKKQAWSPGIEITVNKGERGILFAKGTGTKANTSSGFQ